MSQSVAVIDYGMGNLHSVAKALEKVSPNTKVLVSDDHDKILAADRVIFPGVGAIRDCIAEIKNRHLDEVIAKVAETKPLLGICVGMQALMTHSEENGGVDCLDILPGQVKHFGDYQAAEGQKLKVPHMGWNQVHQILDHPLWKDIEQDERCYFVHSYFVKADNESHIAASTEYGETFAASLARDNIFAVQFHPEKSHRVGLQLLQNFLAWDGQK